MATELIINASLPETRISLMEDGEIQDLMIERATDKGIVGNIYKGRVTRVLPGMQAAFVDIGLEKAAFLYVDDVFVHSEIWEAEESVGETESGHEEGREVRSEGDSSEENPPEVRSVRVPPRVLPVGTAATAEASAAPEMAPTWGSEESSPPNEDENASESDLSDEESVEEDDIGNRSETEESRFDSDFDEEDSVDSEEEEGDDEGDDEGDEDSEPVRMGPPPSDSGSGDGSDSQDGQPASPGLPEGVIAQPDAATGEDSQSDADRKRGRFRRGRRGGRGGRDPRNKKRGPGTEGLEDSAASDENSDVQSTESGMNSNEQEARAPGALRPQLPDHLHAHLGEGHDLSSDRSYLSDQERTGAEAQEEALANQPGLESNSQEETSGVSGRPEMEPSVPRVSPVTSNANLNPGKRPEFREPRSKDRRIKSKASAKPMKVQANIQDLLKEGQEVIVQVAKDPIATKGARLTCHISLPGRHLVCMPTIDHVGVSRRIERDDERRKLRDIVERNRPKGLGFIVRTASGRGQSEKRIRQDIDYLTRIWGEIREKAAEVSAPAMVYEDLNPVLRAIRDWVTEDIDRIVVDSRYHFNEIQRFVSHFMPSLKSKVELYHGDLPIFDSFGISAELSRGLERKVWLKSGGYIVVDQAEALVAIDVNTGRFVGKKNLEDTILKTNLEAVQEIAYQLRLRNCGGIIILDLIDMEKEENKQRVYRALEDALKKDRARPSILKISELGLIEMTRKRTRDTMVRALCESCSHCEGKGFVKGKLTVAYEVLREIERAGVDRDLSKILVQAHSEVIDILAIDERDTLDQLERRFKKQIYLQAILDYHVEQFEISGDKVTPARLSTLQDRNSRDRDSRDRGRNRNRGSRDSRDSRDTREPRESRDRDRQREPQREVRPQIEGTEAPASGLGLPSVRPLSVQPVVLVGTPEILPPPLPGDPTYRGVSNGSPSLASGAVLPEATRVRTHEDDFSEEDRLAFLRAQAAQDAALARLGAQVPAGILEGPATEGGLLPRRPGPAGRPAPGGGNGAALDRGRRGRRGRRGSKNQDRRPKNMRPPSGAQPPVAGPKNYPTPVTSPIVIDRPRTEGGGENGNGNSGSEG